MMQEDDIDALAGEYVLGSLDAAERAGVAARRAADRRLDAAIAAWERRLAPLSAREPGMAPPPHLLDGILTRIAAEQAGGGVAGGAGEVVPLHRRAGRSWAYAFAGALAACLALAAVLLNELPFGPGAPGRMNCGALYKGFWENRDREMYQRMSAEQLAGLSRMALRAFDACEAGDEQDARELFERLDKMRF
jgi:hypothetical protein